MPANTHTTNTQHIAPLTLRDRLRLILRKLAWPQKHLLLARRRERYTPGHRLPTRHAPPEIRAGIEPDRRTHAARPLGVFSHDILYLALDVCEAVEGDIGNFVVDAELFEAQAAAREEHVGFAGGGEVGDAVADEDYEGVSSWERWEWVAVGLR
jgi:hypothetical protein